MKITTISKITIIAFIVLSVVFLVSCDDRNWNALNENPNQPTDVAATNVFGSGMIVVTQQLFGERIGIYYTGTWSGQTAAIGLGDYEFRVDINNSQWDNLYRGMTYFADAKRIAQSDGNENLQAAAMILKAFTAQQVSDMWGDIPYSEAFLLEEEDIDNPVYDSQQEVYDQLLNELETAEGMLSAGGGDIGEGDFIFHGNVEKWRQFANSLRLRIAMRMSLVDRDGAAQVLSQILGNPGTYPVMENNDDNAYIWWPGEGENTEPWRARLGSPSNKTDQYRTNYDLINRLDELNDPRLEVYADENENGFYNGYEMGPGQTGKPLNTGPNVSHIGDRHGYNDQGFSPFMNAAQVWFIKAEAIERGLATGNAQEAYETGIRISLEENEVDEADITAYLAETDVAWDTGTRSNLEKIQLQNWFALFKQSVEAWAEVRRTDVPLLDKVSADYASLGHNRPPFRMSYPANERNHNANFPSDIDEVDIFYGTQVWWDTRTGVQ